MSFERIPILDQDQFEKAIIVARFTKQFPNFYLPHELGFVDEYFRSMVQQQATHGAYLGDAMGQSSETYHDNAPAEAVVSDQEVLVNAVKLLRVNINNGLIVEYPKKALPYITIGSICTLSFDGDEPELCYISGDATGYSNLEFESRFTPISVRSGVGDSVLGLRNGEQVTTEIGNESMNIAVTGLEQPSWPIHTTLAS